MTAIDSMMKWPEPGTVKKIKFQDIPDDTPLLGLAPVGVRWTGKMTSSAGVKKVRPEGNCPAREFAPCFAFIDDEPYEIDQDDLRRTTLLSNAKNLEERLKKEGRFGQVKTVQDLAASLASSHLAIGRLEQEQKHLHEKIIEKQQRIRRLEDLEFKLNAIQASIDAMRKVIREGE